MTTKPAKKISHARKATIGLKHREIRDCYNKLRKKYQLQVVYGFFRQHYFIQPGGVDNVMCRVDKEPVNPEQASMIYHAVMSDTFHL